MVQQPLFYILQVTRQGGAQKSGAMKSEGPPSSIYVSDSNNTLFTMLKIHNVHSIGIKFTPNKSNYTIIHCGGVT